MQRSGKFLRCFRTRQRMPDVSEDRKHQGRVSEKEAEGTCKALGWAENSQEQRCGSSEWDRRQEEQLSRGTLLASGRN